MITVIILSYKSPDLKGALDSVFVQDYPEIQLIVVDDGTPDFDKSAIENYIAKLRRSNITDAQLLVNSENLGTVKSLNRGITQSLGEYVFLLAGDDQFASPVTLSSWVDAFKQTGALVMTSYRDVYDSQLKHWLMKAPSPKEVTLIENCSPKQLFETIGSVNFILGCCTAFNRQIFERYGLFDERYRLIEDHPMVLKLLREGVCIHFFHQVSVKYRSSGTSSPAQYNQLYANDVEAIFENEILPYTSNLVRATRQMGRWKTKRMRAAALQQRIRQSPNTKITIVVARLRYHMLYPIETLVSLITKCRAKFTRR